MIQSVLYIDRPTQKAWYKEWWVEDKVSILREEKEFFLGQWDMPFEDAIEHLKDYYPDAVVAYLGDGAWR